MLCSACQEQEVEVDLGCQHFYCRICLDLLGDRCRDGCTPTVHMPIDDAKSILIREERRLETVELSASQKIAEAEKKLSELVLSLKKEIDAQCLKVKKSEADLETLLARSQFGSRKLLFGGDRFAVREYAKVHFESDCERVSQNTNFGLWCDRDPDGTPHLQIIYRDSRSVIVDRVKLIDTYAYPIRRSVSWLSVIAKNRNMLALRSNSYNTTFIVDLDNHTETQANVIGAKGILLFFRGKELVSCPIPSGFEHASGNIGVRPHSEPDKFELFDPSVGKLELVITDLSRCQARYHIGTNLELGYPFRTTIALTSGYHLGIPYLD
jgi:hypothetical protein